MLHICLWNSTKNHAYGYALFSCLRRFLPYFLPLPQKVTKKSSRHQTSPSYLSHPWIHIHLEYLV